MLLKIVVFLSAAIPLFLFLRSMFGRRQTRLGNAIREARTQIDFAVTLFLAGVGVIVAIALGKIAWTWWTAV